MQLKVIDISSWQHPNNEAIDWHKVAASGVQGVIVKATQGVWYTNPFFHDDVTGALDAGLVVGAYHFGEPGRATPDDQAAYFHGVASGFELALGLWLDLEENGSLPDYEVDGWAQAFLTALDTPQSPAGLYANLTFAQKASGAANSHRLWLANPSDIPNAFSPWMIQTGQGAVDGIAGAVDLDRIPNARGINAPGGGGNPLPPPPPQPAPGPSQADQPTLNEGTHGEAVGRLQEALNSHGAGLTVDQQFGPLTREAVEAFQAANGLTIDGIVGPITWAKLNDAQAHPVEVKPGGEPEISEGTNGPAVVLMQRLLNEHGAQLAVDGAFGALTREAVVAFQAGHGLATDGVCGPHTWAALRS